MKVITWILTLSNLLIITGAITSNIYAPLHIITLKDITPDERRQIAYLEQKLERSKRSGGGSGSGEILNLLKTTIGNGIKKKIGQITKASAAASGEFSRTSSAKGKEYHYPHYPEHVPQVHHHPHEHPSSFNYWDLKKSIVNTLLQAVKAIKGGVLAVKGQLVKGGGKLISASGQLVSVQGDAITNLGKHIATNAILVPYHASSSSKGTQYSGYETEHHYSAPTAPEETYHNASPDYHSGPPSYQNGPSSYHGGPSSYHSESPVYHNGPSASSSDYQIPENYPPAHQTDAAGLLILKKISKRNQAPAINPRQEYAPSATAMIGKFFSASSSLDPQKPNLFEESLRPSETINSYQAYMMPSRTKDEVPALASGAISQTPANQFMSSPFEESPSYLDQNFDNLIGSNRGKTSSKTSEDNAKKKPNINSFNYDSPDNLSNDAHNGYEQLGVLETKPSTDILTYSKPPSIYLQTPKYNYLTTISKDFSPTKDFNLADLDGFKLNQDSSSIQLPNFEALYGQQPLNIDLVPSISYEIGPDGVKKTSRVS